MPDDVHANRLKQLLESGQTAYGLSCMLADAQIVEEFATAGFDYVYIDQQHGLNGSQPLTELLRAAARTTTTPLVRVAANDATLIGQALDAGAEGVIVPMIEDADSAARAVAGCRYQPEGSRSWGPLRAVHGLGFEPAIVNAQLLCLVMIETARGLGNIDAILDVPGVDGVYVGPADLAVSLGKAPRSLEATEDPEQLEAIALIRDACQRKSRVAAITGNPGSARSAGFGMLTTASDIGLITAGLRRVTESVRPLRAARPRGSA